MPRYLVLIVLLLWSITAAAKYQSIEAAQIADSLAARISTSEPVILELRTGEWTPALQTALRKALLLRGADIRELGSDFPTVSDSLGDDPAEPGSDYQLHELGLSSAVLVQVDMDYGWQTIERKTFLSYRQERRQVYNFGIKQIRLPDHKLQAISVYVHERKDPGATDSLISRMKWFEPVFASMALASIIYLLWTTK